MSVNISLVAPCYNEAENLAAFFSSVQQAFAGVQEYDYEVIFVDDGSCDETGETLKQLYVKAMGKIKVVQFLRNFGKEAAIYAGLKECSGDYIAVIDTDCQQDPKYVLEMADVLNNNPGIDMVAATPSNRKDSGLMSGIKHCFYKIANAVSDVTFKNGASDFRVFRREIRDVLLSLQERNRFSKGLFAWVCPDIQCIEYQVNERNAGSTKWSFRKLLRYALNGILSFSHAPLSLSLISAIFEIIASVGCWIWCVVSACTASVSVLSVILGIVFLLASISSFNIWVMGQYIARIHTEVQNRPLYVVKEKFI